MAPQPGFQGLLVALQGVVVTVENARFAAPLAALLGRRLAGRRRPRIGAVGGIRAVHGLLQPAGQGVVREAPFQLGQQLLGLAGPSLPPELRQPLDPFLGRFLLQAVPNRRALQG